MPTAQSFRSTKTYRNFPCAHRRWRHEGHCAHVHGYSRSFTFVFSCSERADNGFVMDFGGLKAVKAWLTEHFDHTLLIAPDDPLLADFEALQAKGACKLVVFDDVGMEGTAHYVYAWVSDWVQAATDGRVTLVSVECRENDKNSAIYQPA